MTTVAATAVCARSAVAVERVATACVAVTVVVVIRVRVRELAGVADCGNGHRRQIEGLLRGCGCHCGCSC